MKHLNVFLLCAVVCISSTALAQSLPEFSGVWTRGGPFTTSGLKNKVVVLYFFEAG